MFTCSSYFYSIPFKSDIGPNLWNLCKDSGKYFSLSRTFIRSHVSGVGVGTVRTG